jgi:deazaflavin-dependent oxidoreductase (nitroreductase family)
MQGASAACRVCETIGWRAGMGRYNPGPYSVPKVEDEAVAMNALVKFSMRMQIALFRLTKGRALSTLRGMPVLLLTTVGRKTGKRRTTPLMYIRDGDSYVVTASNSGSDKHPGWFHNLRASPQAQIEVPGMRLDVAASIATQAERDRLWPQLVAKAPFYDAYQHATTRPIPMVVLRRG